MPEAPEWPVANLARIIAMEFWGKLAPAEHFQAPALERNFQKWIAKELKAWHERVYPGRFVVRQELGEGGVFPIKTFGTSFWPDISVESTRGDKLVAVEVKCLKKTGLPASISQALGQALMYRQVYTQSLVVFVPLQALPLPPPPFFENVAEHDVEVTIVGNIQTSGADPGVR